MIDNVKRSQKYNRSQRKFQNFAIIGYISCKEENGNPVKQIRKDEHRADRTVYKYMNLAYLSPKIISDILDGGAAHVNLQTLFGIAQKYADFDKQEKLFYIRNNVA